MFTKLKRFIQRTRFRQEIILIILAKLAVLTLLWWLFFTKPIEPTLNHKKLVDHYLKETQTTP